MKRRKPINTLAEYQERIEEAKRNGEPLEEVSVTFDMTISEADAKKLYAAALRSGVPQKGRPPFVQPESPGSKRKQ